jgi:hypothetical protein
MLIIIMSSLQKDLLLWPLGKGTRLWAKEWLGWAQHWIKLRPSSKQIQMKWGEERNFNGDEKKKRGETF